MRKRNQTLCPMSGTKPIIEIKIQDDSNMSVMTESGKVSDAAKTVTSPIKAVSVDIHTSSDQEIKHSIEYSRLATNQTPHL